MPSYRSAGQRGAKGIAEGRKSLGHPEGAKTPEGSPTIIWDAVPNEVRGARLTLGRTKKEARQDNERGKRSEGCLANARQDNEGLKGLLRGGSP